MYVLVLYHSILLFPTVQPCDHSIRHTLEPVSVRSFVSFLTKHGNEEKMQCHATMTYHLHIEHKTAITPLLTHWSFCSLAQSHRYDVYVGEIGAMCTYTCRHTQSRSQTHVVEHRHRPPMIKFFSQGPHFTFHVCDYRRIKFRVCLKLWSFGGCAASQSNARFGIVVHQYGFRMVICNSGPGFRAWHMA